MSPALRAVGARKLSTKLVVTLIAFLLIALSSIGLTLLVSWKLEGSAAAINDAGSLRMRAWRLAYLATEDGVDTRLRNAGEIRASVANFSAVLATLRAGDPARPLFLPASAEVARQMRELDKQWSGLASALVASSSGGAAPPRVIVERFVDRVNRLVATIEDDIARTTALLRSAQLALVPLAIAGTVALMYLSFLLVIRPLTRVHEGIERMASGDLSVRVPVESSDEFGQVTAGFNVMAERLQALYQTLESRVEEKTRTLAERTARLSTLYDMAAFLNVPHSRGDMCEGFIERVQQAFGAASGGVRLTTAEGNLVFYATRGVPQSLLDREQCVRVGECGCGRAAASGRTVVQLHDAGAPAPGLTHCRDAGYLTAVATPIEAHGQVLGVFNLFFDDARTVGDDERNLLDSLCQHLGAALENARLGALEKEVAIADERNLLAQELHDSIAQSLAYINLQVQMLDGALRKQDTARAETTLADIHVGVQECYGDVRELLTHYRTRLPPADLKGALRAMLSTFERRNGTPAELVVTGTGVNLAPDRQLQLLHVVHEALSNARKHAACSKVVVTLDCGPEYRVSVRDDGKGFDPAHVEHLDDHVGLRIMSERAARAGGRLHVRSQPGEGTEIVLDVPVAERKGT